MVRIVKRSDPPNLPAMEGRAAKELVERSSWYHSFELLPGLITSGSSAMPTVAACDVLGIPERLDGLKALDVGAWDGPITFELERRGAKAYALDVQDPNRVGFDAARRVLGSHAIHYEASVYDLPFDELTDLDLVVFRGVYYHLKYPLLAFERISASLKLGGMIYFEGEALLNYAENMDGKSVKVDIAAINAAEVPVCASYPNSYLGASNWFVPNPSCLRSWLISSGFEVIALNAYEETGRRVCGSAKKVRETALVEHPIY